MRPLISIIIPLYNSEKWISQTIESAINQSWPYKEIIIIDDGSKDNSLAIAKKYESETVKVFSQPNKGGSAARNRAFAESTGDIIQYLDADDILHPRKIEEQINKLIINPNCIASGIFGNFYNNPEEAKFPVNKGNTDFNNPMDWLIYANLGEAMFPPLVWLTPRSIIEKAGPWNEHLTYNDDTEFFCRVLLNSKGILYCPESISFYRRGIPTSVGSRKDYNSRKSELESLLKVTKLMLENSNTLEVKKAMAYQYSKFIYSIYPNHFFLRRKAYEQLNKLGLKGNFNFGKGKTQKISLFIGWRFAKIVQHIKRKVNDKFNNQNT